MTVRILPGDCRYVLKTLPDASVHCCVTSPPYWGLRDYGVDGQIGLESSVDAWVAEMVSVFREVRRVLRDDGTLWLNLGDSYAGSWGAQSREHAGKHASNVSAISANQVIAAQRKASRTGSIPPGSGLKPKDLIGQPWLVAFALRADGWWLRQEIIWHKPNPMPESVRDRCTKAHEQVFLLSKSASYFYDFEAMQEPVNGGAHARRQKGQDASGFKNAANYNGKHVAHPEIRGDSGGRIDRVPTGWDTGPGSHRHKAGRYSEGDGVGHREGPPGNPAPRGKVAEAGSGIKSNASFDAVLFGNVRDTRNKRSVWTVQSAPFKEAHFATFPPELIRPCVRAGCPPGGVVLDPFGGAGTTGLVADQEQRDAILIELNPAYAEIAQRRITGDAPLFAEVAA